MCDHIKFSRGGQFLACIDSKDVHLFYSFTLERMGQKIACPSSHSVSNLDFNENDTLLSVCSRDGFIQKYDLVKSPVVKTGE